MSKRVEDLAYRDPWPDSGVSLRRDGWVTLRYQAKLITPMMGGGVKKGVPDQIHPFRGSALKAQLRRWWRRLARNGQLPGQREKWGDETLYTEECKRFGGKASDKTGTPIASSTKVRVSLAPNCGLQMSHPPHELYAATKYAWFPATQDADTAKHLWLVKPGAVIDICLNVKNEFQDEIGLVMRWWASFGGFGARTNRGLGSVEVSRGNDILDAVSSKEAREAGVRLESSVTLQNDPLLRWGFAVEKLRRFRQGHDVSGVNQRIWEINHTRETEAVKESQLQEFRRTGIDDNARASGDLVRPYRPGRSKWWDANTVRQLAGLAHEPLPEGFQPMFTKAAFGLPVIGKQINGLHNSPSAGEFEIRPMVGEVAFDRMRSPLIIKAVRTGHHQYRAIAVLLLDEAETALRVNTQLRFTPTGRTTTLYGPPGNLPTPVWPAEPVQRAHVAASLEPVRQMGRNATDPLTAFMNYFPGGVMEYGR